MQGLSHDSIHPSDFFQHFQCQIHYDTGTFVVGILNFQSDTASLPLVYPSGTRNWLIIEAKLEKRFEDKTGIQGILEDSRELRGKTEIDLARTLVIPKDRLTLARVANFSDRPIRLRTDLPVAEYDRVSSEDDFAVSLQPDPDSTSVSHPSSIIDKPVGKERSKGGRKVEVRIARWPRSAFGRTKRAVLSLVMEYEDIFAKESSDFGKWGLLDFAIDTSDCKPVNSLLV